MLALAPLTLDFDFIGQHRGLDNQQPETPEILRSANDDVVVHALPRHFLCRDHVARECEIRPCGGAQEARVVEYACLIVQYVNVWSSTFLHFDQGVLKVASVELMVPAYIKHQTIECIIGPVDSASSCEYHQRE